MSVNEIIKMNIKVLEAIYKEDYMLLNQLFASKQVSPDIAINDVMKWFPHSFVVWHDSYASNKLYFNGRREHQLILTDGMLRKRG